MSESSSALPPRPSLEQLRKQARELLERFHAGDTTASGAFEQLALQGRPPKLADAQLLLARGYGFSSWASLKRHIESLRQEELERYSHFADDLFRASFDANHEAVERIRNQFGPQLNAERIRYHLLQRLGKSPEDSLTLEDTRFFVASRYGFSSWTDLEASLAKPARKVDVPSTGISSSPPFYKVSRNANMLQPLGPVFQADWDLILDVVRNKRIGALHAGGQMTDSVLERLSKISHITSLNLEGSLRVTDDGIRHLAGMPQLESLNLTACGVTDEGLSVLRQLPLLREFSLCHATQVSDRGFAHLSGCSRLEDVSLLGSHSGNGTIRALVEKSSLRHFKSGDQVTDEGLTLLHQFPVYKKWQGSAQSFSLMTFQPEPNLLLLRGKITERGLRNLMGLDGLFGLNLDDSRLDFPASAMRGLASLPKLGWLGLHATDENMPAVAGMPHLRMLMCQDTPAGNEGFRSLGQSKTLEFIWGRRCYNLSNAGFAALCAISSLRGLSVSCRNVGDTALARLGEVRNLTEFMPMDFTDDGFRHLTRCPGLEAVWCMYCRETGDAATRHLTALPRLKTYYAGQTRITDTSLQILSGIPALEIVTLSNCGGITEEGVRLLSRLPRLRELNLEVMPRVSRRAISGFPATVHVNFEI